MEFFVSQLAAWAPTRQSDADWRAWALSDIADDDANLTSCDAKKPKTALVPAMMRRRLTLWGAMAVEVAAQCAEHIDANVPTIFASRHGDTHRTFELLENIVDGEPLSPTAFSLSVHNSSSGIFSIVQKLYAGALAIAAGKETLGHALLEAHTLFEQGHQKILLVLSDIPLVSFYQPFADEIEQSHALALVLEPAASCTLDIETSGRRLEVTFTYAAETKKTAEEGASSLSLPLQFLRFWYSNSETLSYQGQRQVWQFKQ